MLISLGVMLVIWILAFLLKKYVLRSAGAIVSALLGLLLGVLAAAGQLALIWFINNPIPGTYDPMVFMRGAFLTFCISAYLTYSTLKADRDEASST